MDVDLNGTVVRALLNEERAPKTVEAVWNALPFEGKAVHAQVSGEMFRMLEEVPVAKDLETESAEVYHHPGQLIFYPGIREIAFCAGEAMFAGTEDFFKVAPLADIEGDPSAFNKLGDDMQFTGPLPIRFSRSADQETPFRYPELTGDKIEIDFDGVLIPATLLEGESPNAVAALRRRLPLEGIATNTTWGARITRFWPGGRDGERISVEGSDPTREFHWPGYVYIDPADGLVKICYGAAREGLPWAPAKLIPVARIDGDVAPFAAKASRNLHEGQKPMVIRAKS
jgi:hypothetical protein